MIYLASSSPRRRSLLRKMKIAFRVVPTRYREARHHSKTGKPSHLAIRHAVGKAHGVAVSARRGWILGADTLIFFRGKIIGKPKSIREAQRMLKSFSGRTHSVYTAVALIDVSSRRQRVICERTRVTFRRLTEAAIRRYLRRVNPRDKAGGYAIQNGRELIGAIRGSFTNVMGLPVERLGRLLKSAGVAFRNS